VLTFRLAPSVQASHAVTLISTPPLHSWMSALPDDFSLGDVMLPGTHQSTALYGFPISQCQQPSTPLAVQLQDGIRFLGPSPCPATFTVLPSNLH
jgi:1-phosphatidylinositol phosphodiesterase